MSLSTLIIVLIILGMYSAFNRKDYQSQQRLKTYTVGAILTLGGGIGTLFWLGAETSGNNNLFHDVNLLVWLGTFFAGFFMLTANSLAMFLTRSESDRPNDE